MKSIHNYIGGGLLALAMLTACGSEDDSLFAGGEGTLNFNVSIEDQMNIISKTAVSDEEKKLLDENCVIYVRKGTASEGNLVARYEGISSVPPSLPLAVGTYTITVVAGGNFSDEYPVSEKYLPYATFEKKPLYKGTTTAEIVANQSTTAQVACKVYNTLAKVNFDSSLDGMLSYCVVDLSISTTETLQFTQETAGEQTAYFLYPSNKPVEEYTLAWSFTAKNQDGSNYTNSGVIPSIQPNTLYDLTYKINVEEQDPSVGGAFVSVVVDPTPLGERNEEIEVWRRPQIVGNKFDVDKPLNLETGADGDVILYVNASSQLQRLKVSCPKFESGIQGFDFLRMEDNYKATLAEKGIEGNMLDVAERNFKISFLGKFIQSLAEGNYPIEIEAVDINGKSNRKTLNLNISDADIVTLAEVPEAAVWATRATVYGQIIKAEAAGLGFEYRELGAPDWTKVEAVVGDQENFSAQLTGLTPDKDYEFRVYSDKGSSSVVGSFKTEYPFQPENAGFEGWSQPNKPILIYGDGEAMWWDSGNHGSATMSKNVTQSDTQYKHSGNYSAKLASQFVGIGIIGEFVAGNLFVGKYVETVGTNGVLGWGRPCTSRPKALKGYIRYEPSEVTHGADGLINVGDMDKGVVFIALGNWAGESYTPKNGTAETWSVIVKTKEKQFFDPNGPEVIAYGEQTWTEATGGEGMIEFTIPLDYRTNDVKPTHIIITASASKYGDYFAGGNSTMWLDDLELVYE